MKIILTPVLIGLILFSCNEKKDDDSAESKNVTYETSVVGAGSETGTLAIDFNTTDLAAESGEIEITGSTLVSSGTKELAGTYNVSTGALALSTGTQLTDSYSFTGEVDEGKLSGTYTNPTGDGVFAGFDATVDEVKVYCGTYTSSNCDAAGCSGSWNVTTTSAELSVGAYLGNDNVAGILWGTFTNGKIAGEDDGGSVLAGTVVDGVIDGTWELDGTLGTFEASTANCPK